jgi:hypothetical protein
MLLSSQLATGKKSAVSLDGGAWRHGAAQLSRYIPRIGALRLLMLCCKQRTVVHVSTPETKNRPSGRSVSLLWRVHLEKQKSPDYRSVFCFFDFLNRRAFMLVWLLVRMNSLYDKPVFVTCQLVTSNEFCRANCTRKNFKPPSRQESRKLTKLSASIAEGLNPRLAQNVTH